MSSVNCIIEYCTVETSDGVKLDARIFSPEEEEDDNNLAVVLVHPYSILGGCQGLLRGIASGLASRGYKAVTFDMRGVGKSTGKASLTGFKEIQDVIAVCKWASDNLSADKILLGGSSAGAPIAGSAVDKIEQVVGYVSLGYPFGLMASILFGRHHKAILKSHKLKLFVMGTRDGFTSVKQLKSKLKSSAGRVEIHLLEGVGHFEMEGPAYDDQMARKFKTLKMHNGLQSSPNMAKILQHFQTDNGKTCQASTTNEAKNSTITSKHSTSIIKTTDPK